MRKTLFLSELLRQTAYNKPHDIALCHREKKVSYIELLQLVKYISYNILTSNKAGLNIVVCLPKSIETIAILLATLEAKHVAVPINYNDPLDRISIIIQSTQASIVFCTASLLKYMVIHKSKYKHIRVAICLEKYWVSDLPPIAPFKIYSMSKFIDNKIEILSKKKPLTNSSKCSSAYVLHTSGSTGLPKGILLSHNNILNFVSWINKELKLSPYDRILSLSPLTFDISLFDIFSSIAEGASIYLIDDKELLVASKILQTIHRYSITTIYTTPTLYSLLFEYGYYIKYDLSSIKNILCAGEVLSGNTADLLISIFPNASIYNLYGPTETNVCSFYKLNNQKKYSSKKVPIGNVCAGYKAKLSMPKDFTDSKKNKKIRLLHVGGPGVMQGYFINNKVIKNENYYYNTGDLVEVKNKLLYFYGRIDSKKKWRGNLIDLVGINTIIEKLPQIKKSVLLFLKKEDKLICFIKKTKIVKEKTIMDHCKKFLPSYSIPSKVIEINEFPLLSTGKLDMLALEKYYIDESNSNIPN